jgi:site-specific recombinase XerD
MKNAQSDEINAFLAHLAVSEKLSASSQNQALGALLFLFSNLQGTPALVAQILYGSGLRLMEALCLRIKDVHFEKNSIVVRDGKGDKNRITMLPESLKASLQSHLTSLCALHQKDHSGATTSMPVRYRKRCVQPLGHSDAKTTMIYTHVLNRGVVGVKSPADLLFSWQALRTRSAGKP